MKYLFVFLSLLYQTIAWAETTTSYDFSNRTPGVNIYAYEGISGSQLPANNSFPSSQYSASSYSDIATNNNSYHDYINYSKNQFLSIRYVVKIDEDANTINKLNIFWNGYGVNSKRNQTDGVRIYIWNNNSNSYDFVTQNTNDWVVELDQDITSNVANYVDNSGQITVYVVSQKKTFNRESNWIGTDYFRLSVTHDDTPVPATAIANFQFDECAYFGVGNEVVDQFGNYSGTSHNSVNTSTDAQIEKALDILSAQHHVQVNIPLPATFSVSTWFKKPTDSLGNRFFILGAMATGGDLLYLDRNNGWRWGIYDAATGTSIDGNYSFNNLDNSWHHMALVYQNSQTKLYIDGSFIESVNLAPSGTLKYIATSFDGVTGLNPQGFRAPLDEFIIFDGALTSTEITTIYTNQNTGKNYDGSSRDSVSCISAIANYRFDECTYTGSGNDVIDQLGSYSGTSHNSVNTSFDAQIEKALDISSAQHHVQVNIPLPATFSVSTWFKKPTDSLGNRFFILGAMATGGDLLYLDRNNGWRWGIYDAAAGTSIDGNYSFNNIDNSWHHMALVYQNSQTNLYINGSFIETINLAPSGTLKYIGTSFDDFGTSIPQGFRAPLDEFIVFEGALSVADINTIYDNQNSSKNYDGSTRQPSACSQIHHYEIAHDGQGLTCAAEPITIKACMNSDCSTTSGDVISLDLQTDGTLYSGVTITTGSTVVNLSQTSEIVDLTLGIANATVAATNPVVCDDGSGSSCDIDFVDTGFQFLADDTVNAIPTQLSGKPSNTGFNSVTLTLQAIKKSPISGACEAAIINNVDIEMAAKCEDPITCAANQVVINSTGIPTLNNVAALSYNDVSMNFGDSSDNTAEFTFTYPDAGQMKLYARYNIPVDGLPSDVFMEGYSNSFVVRPLGFHLAVTDLPASLDGDADDSVFKKAGEDFEVALTAVQWESGDDTNNDGIPDSNTAISTNSAAVNYGNEVAFETAILTSTIVAPVGGDNGSVANGTYTGTGFTNGVMTRNDVSWSDVGAMTLSVNLLDNSYLGADNLYGSILVGRFTPYRFDLDSKVEGSLRVEPGGLPFAYVGQMDGGDGAIQYLTAPQFTITAVNKDGDTTRNYTFNDNGDSTKDFMKLTKDQVVFAALDSDSSTNGVDSTLLDLDATISGELVEDNLIAKNMTFTMDSNNHFTYHHIANAKIAPFTSDIDIVINSIDDGEGVILADSNDESGTGGINKAGVLNLDPTGVPVRFGRWFIENNFGPETENLPMFMFAQHWDGSNFVTNTLDSHTAYDFSNAANYTLNNTSLSPALSPAVTGILGIPSTFANGLGSFILDKPSDGSQGQIRLIYDTPPDWLKYDWDDDDNAQDGPYDDDPSAIGAFGLFRGNDRIIYWREVSN